MQGLVKLRVFPVAPNGEEDEDEDFDIDDPEDLLGKRMDVKVRQKELLKFFHVSKILFRFILRRLWVCRPSTIKMCTFASLSLNNQRQ